MKSAHLSLIALGTVAASLSQADDTLTGSFVWTVGTLQTQVTVSSAVTQNIPVLVNGAGTTYTAQLAAAPGTVFLSGQPVVLLMAGSLPFSSAAANTSVYASSGAQTVPGIEVGLDATKKTKNNVAFFNPQAIELSSAASTQGGFNFSNGLTLRFWGNTARALPTSYSLTTGTSRTITGSFGFASFGSRNVNVSLIGGGNKGTALGTGGSKTVAFEGLFSSPTGVTPSGKLPFAQVAVGAYTNDAPIVIQ